MNKFGVVLFLVLSGAVAGQTASRPSQRVAVQGAAKPLPVDTVIELAADNRTDWDLAFGFKDEDHRPKDREVAVTDLRKYVALETGPDWGAGLVAEHQLVAKHQVVLAQFLGHVTWPLLYTSMPVRFAVRDGGLALLETSVGSDNVYNTLRLETKERAAKEIEATILPAIKQFRLVNVPEIKSFGVVAIYGVKDFSVPDARPEPEVVALVASVESCRKLDRAEVTEDDFVAASDIYLVGKGSVEARRVRISLAMR